MFRFIIRSLLSVAFLAGTFFFLVQWQLKSELKDFARKIQPFADFNYKAASLSFNGEIRINDINIYIPSINSSVDIRELNLFSGNIYELAMLQSGLGEKKLPKTAYFKLRDVLLPFDSKLLTDLDTKIPVTSLDVMQTAFCGDVERFGIGDFGAMGYRYLSFSSEMSYLLNIHDGSLALKSSFDIEEFQNISLNVKIGGALSWFEEVNEQMAGIRSVNDSFITPDISRLEIKLLDQGFNLNKAEYCATKQKTESDYYTGHVNELEALLNSVEVKMSEKFKSSYFESIQPDSAIQYLIEPNAGFEITNLQLYDYLQLIETTGLKVNVNGKPVELFHEDWSFSKFSKLAKMAKSKKDQETLPTAKYRMTTIQQSFQKVNLNSIDQYTNYRARVTRKDGQVYQGKLSRFSRDNIWITVHSKEGDVTLPVKRHEIVNLEVYQKTP